MRYGRDTTAVFDLLGRDEVDLTAALGWTLTRSRRLLAAVWQRLEMPGDPADVAVSLEVADAQGRTDLELTGDQATVIIEAKKGWLVPGERQLEKYTERVTGAPTRILVSLSDSSQAWAAEQLPTELAGIPVRHLPWDDIRDDLRAAKGAARSSERLWLTELSKFLSGGTSVRDPAEQWVYCVVASNNRPAGGGRFTFREYVTDERVYFHPYGGRNGWPKRPPRFLAFRWEGRIHQVNRVIGHEVVSSLQVRWPDVPTAPDSDKPHIIYDLGPNIPIPHIPTKGTYAPARVWALLDLILTEPTLQGAVRASKQVTSPAPVSTPSR